eukprot:761405-Hanusia_phi.AAC.3
MSGVQVGDLCGGHERRADPDLLSAGRRLRFPMTPTGSSRSARRARAFILPTALSSPFPSPRAIRPASRGLRRSRCRGWQQARRRDPSSCFLCSQNSSVREGKIWISSECGGCRQAGRWRSVCRGNVETGGAGRDERSTCFGGSSGDLYCVVFQVRGRRHMRESLWGGAEEAGGSELFATGGIDGKVKLWSTENLNWPIFVQSVSKGTWVTSLVWLEGGGGKRQAGQGRRSKGGLQSEEGRPALVFTLDDGRVGTLAIKQTVQRWIFAREFAIWDSTYARGCELGMC